MRFLARTLFVGSLIAFLIAAQAQTQSTPSAAIDAVTRKLTVEGAIRQLNERYVFPNVATKAEAALSRNMQENAYDGFDDAAKFAAKLTDDLQALTNDKHIRVRYVSVEVPETPQSAPSEDQLAQFRKQVAIANYGVEKVERLPLNVGYIDLRRFAPAEIASETISATMTLVANTDALIVDLRKNGGGDPATVAFMTSYLFDERTHLNNLYSREENRTSQFWTQDWVPGKRFGQKKPVFVLTAKRTFSGAEEFSYNLKNLKRATLVGEVTGGGAHPGSMRRVSAHFMMFVPNGRAISPITNTNWEGIGVEPDVKVSADDALRTAQILALERILEAEKDADYRQRLKMRIGELEKEAPKS